MTVTVRELVEAVYEEQALSWVGDVEPGWLLDRLNEISFGNPAGYQARHDAGDLDIEIRAKKSYSATVDFLLNDHPRLRLKVSCCPIDSWEVVSVEAVGDDQFGEILRKALEESVSPVIQSIRVRQ